MSPVTNHTAHKSQFSPRAGPWRAARRRRPRHTGGCRRGHRLFVNSQGETTTEQHRQITRQFASGSSGRQATKRVASKWQDSRARHLARITRLAGPPRDPPWRSVAGAAHPTCAHARAVKKTRVTRVRKPGTRAPDPDLATHPGCPATPAGATARPRYPPSPPRGINGSASRAA